VFWYSIIYSTGILAPVTSSQGFVGGAVKSNSHKSSALYLIIQRNIGSINLLIYLIGIFIVFSSVGSWEKFNQLLIQNQITQKLQVLILLSSGGVLLISNIFVKNYKVNLFEYHIILFLASFGLCILITCNDSLGFYLAIEMQSLCLYIIASFKRSSSFSTEAGIKYFVLGALISGILLFGVALLYGFVGTTNFIILQELLLSLNSITAYNMPMVILGLLFLASSLFFKIAAFPFHTWIADVYEGAPTSVTAYFAIVPKIAIFGLLVYFYDYICVVFQATWLNMFLFSAIGSLLLASFLALYQKKLKRLLAYGAISHSGFILIGILVATHEGTKSAFLYLFVYVIMSLGMFSFILNMQKPICNNSITTTALTAKQNLNIQYIIELTNFSNKNYALAISVALYLFSFAGIPPLAGFYTKLCIFLSAIDMGYYLLATVAILTSVIACVYYIRIIKVIFFDNTVLQTTGSSYWFIGFSKENSLVQAFCLIFIITFLIYPNPYILLVSQILI